MFYIAFGFLVSHIIHVSISFHQPYFSCFSALSDWYYAELSLYICQLLSRLGLGTRRLETRQGLGLETSRG